LTLCRAAGVRCFEIGRFRAGEPSAKERAVTQYKSQFGGALTPVVNFRTGFDRRTRLLLASGQLPRRAGSKLRRLLVH